MDEEYPPLGKDDESDGDFDPNSKSYRDRLCAENGMDPEELMSQDRQLYQAITESLVAEDMRKREEAKKK